MFTIAIHFYRLSCECEPQVYESLVDVLSTQCVKSFNRALPSALHGQYGKPKFRSKQACLNLQHKISSHHLVHFNDTQRSSILLPIFLFIFTLLWTFFQSWYDWLMFRGVGRFRCWCRVRGNSVANHFGVNVSTIERLVRRLRETGHLADRPRSGRPRVTSRRQDRTIRLAHLRNRHLTATKTALNTVGTHNRQISPKTVGRRLREIGLRARRPYVGLPLTQARRLRRMAWLTAHAPRLFPMRQWRRVLFTDESRFTLYRTDGRRRVYRRRGERFADACCRTGSVWGWLRYGLGRHCSRDKITVDYCCGQYDRSKV